MAKHNDNHVAIFALILIGAFIASALFALGKPSISGAAGSGTGLVNVTVGTLLSVIMRDSAVEFGTGYVTSPQTYAMLDSNSTTLNNWTNTSTGAGGWPVSTDFIVIENNGNSNVAINISAASNASSFIGGSSSGGPSEEYFSFDNESNSCTGSLQTNYTTLTTAQSNACTVLAFADDNDAINVYFRLKIPSDAATGLKSNTITFTGF
jgi:hypothetical protein